MVVRVVVPQDEIGLVRKHVRGVEVKLAEALSQSIAASVTRGVPAAQEQLPSRVLGSAGGLQSGLVRDHIRGGSRRAGT